MSERRMQKNKVVNICYVTDEAYAMPACISAFSAIFNKMAESYYNIYILCKNVSDEKKKYFEKLECNTVKMHLIDILDKKDYTDFRIDGIPATPTSIFKFYIPEILKDIDRVIFIDCDTIVQRDLTQLYNIELNGKMVGAVKNPSRRMRKTPAHAAKCRYFNSGVMLMDLKQMREKDCSQKMMDYRTYGINRLMDQDAINAVMRGSAEMIPFCYNTMIGSIASSLFWSGGEPFSNAKTIWGLEEDTIDQTVEDAVILHYYAATKPWKYYDGYGGDIWYYYYMLSPYKMVKLERKSNYLEKLAKSKSYRVGDAVVKAMKLLKPDRMTSSDKEYENFLTSFYDNME